ncbi:polysaccharide biosynthesis protein [Sphingopyxis sp. MSC1_008]|jgi:FlaA1/EpsC-like NDP-sugar epimerase|uniref:polysaccharide biosynthesis protein n=1 Tax=Sphingopyxis sp. MSC1_008 TaxID=2909265 RepID=UPI0020C05536|nr:nucleoside-diphosphate sugar epimerase/dehydratase [Sphingopyxis sp. MSC1_008]
MHFSRVAKIAERQFRQLDRVVTRLLLAFAHMPRSRRRWVAIAMDAIIGAIAVWGALFLRTGDPFWGWKPYLILTVTGLSIWFLIAVPRKTYMTLLRFAGGRTMMGLGVSVAIMAVPMTLLFMIVSIPGVPRTMGLLFPVIFLSLLCLSRLLIRFALVDILAGGRPLLGTYRRVAIYGAGRAGQQLAMGLRHESQLKVVAFIDDDARLDEQLLDGIPVFAASKHENIIDDFAIQEILLAIPSATRARRREIVEFLSTQSVAVRTLPSVGHIVEGRVAISDLRDVQIEELLGRDPVPPNELLMGRNIAGRVVLVTGAGGSIGSELCRQIIGCRPSRLILVEQSEFALYQIDRELVEIARRMGFATVIVPELCDVADQASIGRVLRRYQPETLFHAAAYKHVPLVESNPIAGLRNNVMGTLNTVLAAEGAGVGHFILVSTDKAVRPTNVMGASKRICELILQARAAEKGGCNLSMVRFGNVLGSSGSVVPLFKQQIASGGPVTITDRRVTRYFMTIPEAAQLVIQAGSMARGGEVFMLEMGQPVRIYDLAATMIRLSGLSERTPDNPEGDIELREIGLRPGEKLYEELLLGNNPRRTKHERIVMAEEVFLAWAELEKRLSDLAAFLEAGDSDRAKILMAELVPEYHLNEDAARESVAG